MLNNQKADRLKQVTGEIFVIEEIEKEFEKRGYKRESITIDFLNGTAAADEAGFIYLTDGGKKPDYLDADAYIVKITSHAENLTQNVMYEITKDIPALKDSAILFEMD